MLLGIEHQGPACRVPAGGTSPAAVSSASGEPTPGLGAGHPAPGVCCWRPAGSGLGPGSGAVRSAGYASGLGPPRRSCLGSLGCL